LRKLVRSLAALGAAVFLAQACAPVAEPLIAPVPSGAAGDTAPRPLVRPLQLPPEYQQAVSRGTRTATGQPGPRYWQQGVRYAIDAELNPQTRELRGRERVVYRNNSPDSLRAVVLNLYQNLFRATGVGEGARDLGLNLQRVAAQGQTLPLITEAQLEDARRSGRQPPGYSVQGTLGRVYLPRTLASGDSAVFEFEWSFRVPPAGAPRTGYEDALGGRVFQVAQWYPQIATYDDVAGLDITPYTGQGEFYLEYGDFDYSVTLPAGWIIGGTGTLRNPEQVLTPQVRERLARALQTDSVVNVVTRANVGQATLAGTNGQVTWRFSAQNVRDVAFATSNRYLWDATRAAVPAQGGGTRNVAIHTLYRAGAPNWESSARYARHSIGFFSRQIIPYIYPHMTVSEGPVYGMEYPMLNFVGRPPGEELALYEVVAHEIGHEWFPMMVGQDEAAFAWMDEGFTTFHEALAVNDYFPRADHFAQPRNVYLSFAGRKQEVPLMRSADQMDDNTMGIAAYYKPGTLLRSLRGVMGDEAFDRGMREYASAWLLKHPYPWDWFSHMERAAGQDLDWFFQPWWFTTATMDLAVGGVTQSAGQVSVTVRDLGQAPAPAIVVVTTRDGRTVSQTITPAQWLNPNRRAVTITIPVQSQAVRVEIDPQQVFPDVNRRNNVWTGS
jgi:hypothetical protein